ncbi:MAG: poly(A) polymerase [Thermoleophilaceae bacterium]|nr:poly(A) polymerase [Thermoleophilaceae bacterium]MEA2401228.1 poly(A) polymerase [Thermoleophilaceae bacterium]
MSDAWIVGGSLRDELLGRPVRDVDVAVAGDPAQAARALAADVRGPVFQLSEAFGAWRVIDRRADRVYDFAPLQGDTIEADLAQRDFTINAMARPVDLEALSAEPSAADLVDPLGGRADLESGTLRVLGPDAYQQDPLRTLRLARFVAELGFAADPETERLTSAAAPRATEAAGERVFGELRRLVIADGALAALELADRLGVLGAVLPELTALHGVEQSDYHHLDVYDHTLEVLAQQIEIEGRLDELFGPDADRLRAVLAEPLADELTRGQALRFGALVHDIGKPVTRDVRADGRITFMGHDAVGEQMVGELSRRLRTSERFARFLGALTRQHLVLGFLVHERPLDRAQVYRYLRRTSPVEVEVTLLSCADRLATQGRRGEEATAVHLELARELMTAALDWREQGPPRVPVRGDELADELGIEPGPELGRLLGELEEAAYVGEAATREQAIAVARRLLA